MSAAMRATPLHPDEHDADDDASGTGEPDRASRVLRQPQQANVVEGQRAEHLTNDDQGQGGNG